MGNYLSILTPKYVKVLKEIFDKKQHNKLVIGGSLALNILGVANRKIQNLDFICDHTNFDELYTFFCSFGKLKGVIHITDKIERIDFILNNSVDICLWLVELKEFQNNICSKQTKLYFPKFGFSMEICTPEYIINEKKKHITFDISDIILKKHIKDISNYENIKQYPSWVLQMFNNRNSGYFEFKINKSSIANISNLTNFYGNYPLTELDYNDTYYGCSYFDNTGTENFGYVCNKGLGGMSMLTAKDILIYKTYNPTDKSLKVLNKHINKFQII